MSNSTPTPDIPKPSLPKPNIPKPNIPKPSIPAPNLDRANVAPPVSAVETGAMEAPAPKAKTEVALEEDFAPVEYSETLLPQRILAGVVDCLIAIALISVAQAVLPDFLGTALAMAYLLFKDSLPFLGGQSIGKKITKIQAVTEGGEPLTGNNLTKGLIRNVFAAVFPLALVEIFILNSREKAPNAGQRLGDGFAQTKVIAIQAKEAPSADSPED